MNFRIVIVAIIIIITVGLGIFYSQDKGVSENRQKVAEYQKAAEQGDADAQQNLARSYYHGEGVAQNYKEAFEWSQKAAHQGNAKAQNNLASSYYNGEGVAQNYKEAYIWSSLAATDGDEGSVQFRDTIQNKLAPEVLQKAQAEAQSRQKEIQSRSQK